MEFKAERRSEFQQRMGLSDEEFQVLVERGALEVLRPPGSDEEMVAEYAMESLVRRGIAALLREHETPTVEYRWSKKTAAMLQRHPEIRELLARFLGYIRDNTSGHHVLPLKWSLRVSVAGYYCNVAPTSRGLKLSVTREKKEETKFVRSRADFADALRWIKSRSDPWPMKGSPQKMKERTPE